MTTSMLSRRRRDDPSPQVKVCLPGDSGTYCLPQRIFVSLIPSTERRGSGQEDGRPQRKERSRRSTPGSFGLPRMLHSVSVWPNSRLLQDLASVDGPLRRGLPGGAGSVRVDRRQAIVVIWGREFTDADGGPAGLPAQFSSSSMSSAASRMPAVLPLLSELQHTPSSSPVMRKRRSSPALCPPSGHMTSDSALGTSLRRAAWRPRIRPTRAEGLNSPGTSSLRLSIREPR